jgi:hypothetical protein
MGSGWSEWVQAGYAVLSKNIFQANSEKLIGRALLFGIFIISINAVAQGADSPDTADHP